LDNQDSMNVIIDALLTFDPLTRLSILKRIQEIFSTVVETKQSNYLLIDGVLCVYFSELGESVKASLTKDVEEREPCCANCLCF